MEHRAKARLTTVRRQHQDREVEGLSERIRTGLIEPHGAERQRAQTTRGIPLRVISAAKGPLGVSKAAAKPVGTAAGHGPGTAHYGSGVVEAASVKLQQSYNLSLQRFSKAERVYEKETTDPDWVPFRPKTQCLDREEQIFGLEFEPPGMGMGKQASSYLSNMRNILDVLMIEHKPPESFEEAERVRTMLRVEEPPPAFKKCTHQREYEEPQRECRHKRDLQSAMGMIVALVGLIPEDARAQLSTKAAWVREAALAAEHSERLAKTLRVQETELMEMHDADALVVEQMAEHATSTAIPMSPIGGRKGMLEPVAAQQTPTIAGIADGDPTRALQQRLEDIRRLESELNLQRKATQLEAENKTTAESTLQLALKRTKFLADSMLNFICSTHLLLANWHKPPGDTAACHIPAPPIPKEIAGDDGGGGSASMHPLATPSRLSNVLTQMWENFAAVKDARPNCPIILTNINALLDDCDLLPSRVREAGAATTFVKPLKMAKKPPIEIRTPSHKLPIEVVTDVTKVARRKEPPKVPAKEKQQADNIFGLTLSPTQDDTAFLPELINAPADPLALSGAPPLETFEQLESKALPIRRRSKRQSMRKVP